MSIKIPCEYHHPEGRECEEGKVLIFGEMGGRPPETITCPQCHGAGMVEVERQVIVDELEESLEELEELNDKIERLKRYLIPA